MKLTPIETAFQMDYGAPCPLIMANDNHLLVAFLGDADTPEDDHVIWVEEIASVRRQYDPDSRKKLKHYILTFHDNMFECVAESFTILEPKEDLYQQANWLLREGVR